MQIRNELPPWLLESCVLSTYHTVAYSRTLYVKCEWTWTAALMNCCKMTNVSMVVWKQISIFTIITRVQVHLQLAACYCSAIAGCHFHVPFSGNLFFIVSKRKVGFVLPQNLMSEVCDLEKLPRFSFGELSMEERSECIDEQWGVSLFTTTKRK